MHDDDEDGAHIWVSSLLEATALYAKEPCPFAKVATVLNLSEYAPPSCPDLTVLWVPLPQASYILSATWELLVDILGLMLAQGRDVLVHCRTGANRGPALVAGYLALTGELSFAEALRQMETIHPLSNLHPETRRSLEYWLFTRDEED